MSWPRKPTLPAFCSSSRITPGFFDSMSATRGMTSFMRKSSAVSFIMRCSSESISGVKIVTEPVGSRRNPPPGERVIEGALMATGYQLRRRSATRAAKDDHRQRQAEERQEAARQQPRRAVNQHQVSGARGQRDGQEADRPLHRQLGGTCADIPEAPLRNDIRPDPRLAVVALFSVVAILRAPSGLVVLVDDQRGGGGEPDIELQPVRRPARLDDRSGGRRFQPRLRPAAVGDPGRRLPLERHVAGARPEAGDRKGG